MRKTILFFFLIFGVTNSQNNSTTKMKANVFNTNLAGKEIICQINKGKEIEIIEITDTEYVKVKYKRCIGYVARITIIETEFIQTEIDKILNAQAEEEKQKKEREQKRLDSIAKRKEMLKKREKFRQDSIKEQKKKEIKEKIRARKLKDSIAEVERIKERRSRCHYTQNEVDKFTNKIRKVTEYYEIAEHSVYLENSVDIRLARNGNYKFIYFYIPEGLGCASPYNKNDSYVIVRLKNNVKVKFYHEDDIDCSSDAFMLVSSLTTAHINKLKSSPIEAIRFLGSESYYDVENINYENFFIDKLSCLNKN
ncbi:hypothetical protein [Winogradskyella poriferorum]|uniref:hypothetical protein n=1 Tax=Winogradskyella poriferorum TaxID=307627 RepID=UPI003D6481C1